MWCKVHLQMWEVLRVDITMIIFINTMYFCSESSDTL